MQAASPRPSPRCSSRSPRWVRLLRTPATSVVYKVSEAGGLAASTATVFSWRCHCIHGAVYTVLCMASAFMELGRGQLKAASGEGVLQRLGAGSPSAFIALLLFRALC